MSANLLNATGAFAAGNFWSVRHQRSGLANVQGDIDTLSYETETQGETISNLPASMTERVEILQIGINLVQSVTLPIIGSDDKKLIGYVRASKSLEDF